jgi:hypothetical protein
MISAYKNVKGMACAKCGKMYDSGSAKPLARRVKSGDGVETEGRAWEAVHEDCLD